MVVRKEPSVPEQWKPEEQLSCKGLQYSPGVLTAEVKGVRRSNVITKRVKKSLMEL